MAQGKGIKPLIMEANKIAIICAERGSDAVASGIALAEYLKDRYSKQVNVFYSGDINSLSSDILSEYEVESSFGERSLRISLNYKGTNINSVDYSQKEDGLLVLDIKPVDQDFDVDRIKYEYVGVDFDLVFVIGSANLESLGTIYTQNIDLFSKNNIINIDNSESNTGFGTVNIVNSNTASLSALILQLFSGWGYELNKKISKILLLGLIE